MSKIKARTKPTPPPPKFKGGHRRGATPPRRLNCWDAVLRASGYPTRVLVLDFETYFDDDYSMRGDRLSTIEYIMDERFEALGLAVLDSHEPGAPRFYRGPEMVQTYLGCLQKQHGPSLGGVTIAAQNAQFDAAILAYRYGIYPRYLIDTLGLARHWDSRNKNDLGSIAKRLGLEVQKGDTKRFKGWTTVDRFLVPKSRAKGPSLPIKRPKISDKQWQELADYALDDVQIEFAQLQHYLPRLSNPATELRVCQHTLELFTKPTLKVDDVKAEDLKQQMNAEIDRAVAEVGRNLTRGDLSGENSFEALLADALTAAGDEPRRYGKPTKKPNKDWMFAIAKADPDRQLLEQHPDGHVRSLMAARAAVKSWPLHIARIDRIVRQAKAAGGYLPVPLKYSGAHTGRWSGGEKINLQNLGSRGHELVNAVRELLVADEGQELVIADASQIEARVLAWVAGQWDLVEKFASGEEIYCDFAQKVLGRRVRKPRPGGIPAVEARHKWARNSVGKVGVLGCIAEGTPILTQRGWVAVERVQPRDKVWDGGGWVSHAGVVYQGEKPCIERAGVWLTEDHEIYGKDGWCPAVCQSTDNLLLATPLGTSRWKRLSLGPEAGLSASNAAAPAAGWLSRFATTWSPESLHAAMRVLKLLLHGPIHTALTARSRTAADFLTAFVQSWDAATHAPTRVTADAVSLSTLRGSPTEQHFFDTCSRLMGGTSQSWRLIARTTIGGMNPAIYGLSLGQKTCGTWDIIRAGSNRRYQAGPLLVANCGYGMGPTKAVDYAQGAIDLPTAERLVSTYRAENDLIVQFWKDLERAFLYTFKYKQPCEMPRGLRFETADDCDVLIVLPNGRELKYHHVKTEPDTYGGERLAVYNALEHRWGHIWGGHLTENVVQAISRDILWDAIWALEQDGTHVALHVHDELIAVVPEGTGEAVLDQAVEHLSTRPTWGRDLPLAAEGVVAKRYGGH